MDEQKSGSEKPLPDPSQPDIKPTSLVTPSDDSPKVLKHSESFGQGVRYAPQPDSGIQAPEAKVVIPAKPLPRPKVETHAPPPTQAPGNKISLSVWPPIDKPLSSGKTPTPSEKNNYTPPMPLPLSTKPVTRKTLIAAVILIAIIVSLSYVMFGRSSTPAQTKAKTSSSAQTTSTTTGTPADPSGSADQNTTNAAGATNQIQGDVKYCQSNPLLNC